MNFICAKKFLNELHWLRYHNDSLSKFRFEIVDTPNEDDCFVVIYTSSFGEGLSPSQLSLLIPFLNKYRPTFNDSVNGITELEIWLF